MCPMCEKRAQLLLRQQAVVESNPASSKPSNTDSSTIPDKASLFRNPFKACKHLTHQCCNPRCESQRTSIASGRRSSAIAPVTSTPEHSGEFSYIVSESPLSAESKDHPEPQQETQAGSWPPLPKPRRRKGLLTRLKALTHAAEPMVRGGLEPSSTESSFGACGRKVTAVADELDQEEAKAPPVVIPSLATLLAAETDLEEEDDDSMRSDVSVAVTETNVSETTILSMMNLNGSFSSPYEMTTSNRGSTLKSSAYDDDASSFAVVPRTSMNSSFLGRGGVSDASGLSDRFGELDIGYLSLEESGEGPEFDDTVSISSEQSEHLELELRHAQDDTVSESDLDQEYSISTDSQEWVAETDDAASVLQHSRTPHTFHRQTSPPPLPRPPSDPETQQSPVATPKLTPNPKPSAHKIKTLVVKKDAPPKPKSNKRAKLPPPPERPCTEYLCSRCGRKESSQQQQTTKNVTTKANPMSTFFKTFMGDEEQAVMAAKVVVLLGKYGNRKGLRVSGLSPQQQQQQQQQQQLQQQTTLSVKELNRLRTIMCPKNDAISAFQNEVARMMLEGVDVPELNMDVEQFIAGYMKLNSPFYIDLIQDFFKSVCIDCFGHMESVTGAARRRAPTPPRPAYAVLKPRKTKTIAGRGNNKLLQ